MMAALVLLRVMQKRETRELRRLQLLEKDQPKYYLDTREVFAETPSWMSLDHALHFLKMSMAAYGWPFVMYQYPATGLFRMCPHMTCCACFRCKATEVKDDNCCLCHLAGVRYTSQVDYEDIIYASFSNDMCQLPFFVLADHKTSSIAIVVRGSISLRDVFTDLIAGADLFEAPGLPENSMAHRGISLAAYYILKTLETSGALEKAFILYPHYKLVLTGHSLGAGVSVLLALLLRPRYPDLKVYAISPPAGLLSREAARVTEEFTFSVGIGDDFVMRLSVDSIENIRTNALRVLKFCKLPKYRIMLNGFGYAIFGIPTRDLESTWKNDLPTPSTPGQLPLLLNTPPTSSSDDSLLFVRDISQRRFSRTHLYIPGKILHITRRKKTKQERKTNTGGPTYEMRWAVAEEFTEFRIMPRMILDHLPDNIYKAFETVLDEQKQIRKRVPTVAVL
ncbi:Lipase containing protein, putative [Gryllus bimaculatus]|nr:Lipase containing protein, putative [Gryllus bimaculatus]